MINAIDQIHPMSIDVDDFVFYPPEQKIYRIVEFGRVDIALPDTEGDYSFDAVDEWGERETLFFGDDEIVILTDGF